MIGTSMTFSFLMPTRNRPQLVSRLFESIIETTANPDQIEIILAVDDDDQGSQKITHDRLVVKTVILPQGSTMGTLNRACFEASRGRYVMLINDDVILRSKDWDLTIAAAFAKYPDDIALIHVNDLLFREKLCTFPMLSRRACLEIGICPAEYRRYRIDDDIYDTYKILAYLGHKRITYLPEVIFEHENFARLSQAHRKNRESLYIAEDDKVYLPNPEIHEQDTIIFEGRLEQRKSEALRLAALIDPDQNSRRRREYEHKLIQVQDPYSHRRPHFVNSMSTGQRDTSTTHTNTTVAVVTSNIYKKHAQKCLAAIKKHTQNIELLILDNNNSRDFAQAKEMNKVLHSVNTDFLVLMHDDVFVGTGWLQGLLASMDEETGVVAPMHKDRNGAISFSGTYLIGDGWGTHAHLTDVPQMKRGSQSLHPALLLIDMKKCGQIFFDEQYKKYFFDLDYSFRVWEVGYKAVCTPDVVVTHLGEAAMDRFSKQAQLLYNRDLKTFVEEWIDTGRLARLGEAVWSRQATLKQLTSIPQRINHVFDGLPGWEDTAFQNELHELLRLSGPYELFKGLLHRRVCEHLSEKDEFKAKVCKEIHVPLRDTPWVHSGPLPVWLEFYKGYELIAYGDHTFAVPMTMDYTVVVHEELRSRPEILTARTVELLKDLVDHSIEKVGYPGNSLARLRCELIRFDKWARRERRGGLLLRLVSWGYVQLPGRVIVASSIRLNRLRRRLRGDKSLAIRN